MTRNQYYYWQRKVRKATYLEQHTDLPQTVPGDAKSATFVELPSENLQRSVPISSPFGFLADAVIRTGRAKSELPTLSQRNFFIGSWRRSAMLSEAYNVRKIVIATGYTDLRKGIEGLSELVLSNYHLNPAEKDVLFLFCGRRADRIKGLLWEGDGFLLLYKRLEAGSFSWPRSQQEAAEPTREQYHLLMMGFDPVTSKIQEVNLRRMV